MATATLKVIRHQDGEVCESYRNLQVDCYNADIIIGESDIAQLITQGYLFDEGVMVDVLHMQSDDVYTADMVCVNADDFYGEREGTCAAKIRSLVKRSVYTYHHSYNVWFKIIDDVPSAVEFQFDRDEIWACQIYQNEETDRILLLFLTDKEARS